MVLHYHASVTLLLQSNPICHAAATSVISTLRFAVTLYYRPSTCYSAQLAAEGTVVLVSTQYAYGTGWVTGCRTANAISVNCELSGFS